MTAFPAWHGDSLISKIFGNFRWKLNYNLINSFGISARDRTTNFICIYIAFRLIFSVKIFKFKKCKWKWYIEI
jgi:hypothetical protein